MALPGDADINDADMDATPVGYAICLRACYAMSGTDLASGPTRYFRTHQREEPVRRLGTYSPMHLLCDVRYRRSISC
eukprot:143239-Rhodomonas_salina.2